MTAIAPRHLVHRGVLPAAAGLCFSLEQSSTLELRRRILAQWRDGDRLLQGPQGYLLAFGEPRRVDCRTADASPVILRAGVFLALPLTPGEWRDLQPPPGSLVLGRGGRAEVITGLATFDVAQWLDVSGWGTVAVGPLGSMPSLPMGHVPFFDIRQELGIRADPGLAAFLARLGAGPQEAEQGGLSQWLGWLEILWERLQASVGRQARIAKMPPEEPVTPANDWLAHPAGRGLFLIWLAMCLLLALMSARFEAVETALSALALVVFTCVAYVGVLLMQRAAQFFGSLRVRRPAKPVSGKPAAPSRRLENWRLIVSMSAGLYLAAVNGTLLVVVAVALTCAALVFGVSGGAMAVWNRLGKGKKHPKAAAGPPAGTGRVKGPSALAKLRDAWRLMLWHSSLRKLFGQRQAAYMLNSLRLFERGDLEAALRHAISLGDLERLSGGLQAPVLGVPRPRTRLELTSGDQTGGGIALPDDFKQQLLRHYRAAYEKLAALKRIHEASFVLAELLSQPGEAVAYLESEGEFRLAAEMAALRRLDPAIEVRLWWLAGDTNRAVLVARQRRAFAGAVERLEAGGAEHAAAAARLRLLGADNLARAGDFSGAVEVARHLPQARGLLGSWIEAGYAAGGTVAAAMLARQAILMEELTPEAREVWAQRVTTLLAAATVEPGDQLQAQLRLAFAFALPHSSIHPLVAAAMRRAVRALLRDGETFPPLRVACSDAARGLAKVAGDGPLRYDLARWPEPAAADLLAKRPPEDPLVFECSSADRGALPVSDAALLANGITVVALGELGVRLLARNGRTLCHLDQPCHHLVLAANGDRAIGVAHRTGATTRAKQAMRGVGGSLHLSRLDLAGRKASPWGLMCDVMAFADSYDGSLWMAATSERLLALDATAAGPVALWNTPGVGRVHRVVWSPDSLATLSSYAEPSEHNEVWRFDWPSLTLRQRSLAPQDCEFVTAGGHLLQVDGVSHESPRAPVSDQRPRSEEGQNPLSRIASSDSHTVDPDPEPRVVQALDPGESGCAYLSLERDADSTPEPYMFALRLGTLDGEHFQKRLEVLLRGAGYAHARLHAGIVTLCDDCGRVLAIDLQSGLLLRNLRIY